MQFRSVISVEKAIPYLLTHLTRTLAESVYFSFFIVCCVGNVMNIQTGQWVGVQSGLGAGQDSFYEYLLKVRMTQ